MGNTKHDVIISCHPLTSISFIVYNDLRIESLTFLGCTVGTESRSNANQSFCLSQRGLLFDNSIRMNSVVLSYSNVSDSLRLDDNTKNRNKKLYSESSRPDCTHIPPGGILYLPDVDNNVRMVLVVTINSVGGYIPAVFDNYKLAIYHFRVSSYM